MYRIIYVHIFVSYCVCGSSCGTIENEPQNNHETQQKQITRKSCESEATQ